MWVARSQVLDVALLDNMEVIMTKLSLDYIVAVIAVVVFVCMFAAIVLPDAQAQIALALEPLQDTLSTTAAIVPVQ